MNGEWRVERCCRLLDTVHTGVIMYIWCVVLRPYFPFGSRRWHGSYLKLVTNYFQPQLLTKSVWPMNVRLPYALPFRV